MQVVILAGGRGERLKPITLETPKPMVIIHGKPFLRHQIEFLKTFGLTEFLLLIGYLGSYIEEYFGDGSKLGLKIRYSYEKELLGTGGALKNAEDKLFSEFLLLNGDTYLPIDYGKLIGQFHLCNKLGMIVAYKNSDRKIPSNMRIDGPDSVVGYNKNNSRGMTHIDAGAAVFSRKVLGMIPKDAVYSLQEGLFPELIAQKELAAFPVEQRFYDMGSPDGLKEIEDILK